MSKFTIASFRILSDSLIINEPIIQRYTVWAVLLTVSLNKP
jgi:hypothetical protein